MPINNLKLLLEQLMELKWEDFSESTIERTKWILADTVFVTRYGCQSPELQNYIHVVGSKEIDDRNTMPIIGEEYYTSPYHQAMIHGTAIVSNELDEGNQFAKGHPAAHVFPTALIAALENNASGQDFMRAFIIGYEVSARFALASSMNDDMHPHGTWGMIGGTVAAGILQKRNIEELTEAVLLAASLPLSTSWEAAVNGMTVRNLYTGIGCFQAYNVLQLQSFGFRSSPDVVDHLWGKIMSKKGINYDLFFMDLLDPPLIEKNYFKFYPSCRFSHSAIDALNNLLSENQLNVEDISSVFVETYDLAARLSDQDPQNTLAAKFSIPFLISALLNGYSLYGSYKESNFFNTSIRKLAKLVSVSADPELTALLPEKRAARVTVNMKDGSKMSAFVDSASGEYNVPFSESRMMEKLNQMMSGYMEENRIERLVEKTMKLDEINSIKDWVEIISEK